MACPVCGKPTQARYQPFCSKRCADVDLGRWLGEGYVVAGEPSETTDAAPGLESMTHTPGEDDAPPKY